MEKRVNNLYKKDIVLLYFREMGVFSETYEIRQILGFEKKQMMKFLELMVEEGLLTSDYNLTEKSKSRLNEKYIDEMDFIKQESYNGDVIPNDEPLGIDDVYIPFDFHP